MASKWRRVAAEEARKLPLPRTASFPSGNGHGSSSEPLDATFLSWWIAVDGHYSGNPSSIQRSNAARASAGTDWWPLFLAAVLPALESETLDMRVWRRSSHGWSIIARKG